MNQIKKITLRYNLAAGCCLMVLFLFAVLSKASFTTFPHKEVNYDKGQQGESKNHLSSVTGSASYTSVLQKVQDNDTDDLDAFVPESYNSDYIANPVSKCDCSSQKLVHTRYKIALYDLYCNWKHYVI